MTSTTGFIQARDGTRILTRRWEANAPWASLVIVHGLSEHSGRWEHVGDHFAALGYDVHAIDLRGHGQSGGIRIDVEEFDHYLDDVEMMVESVRALGRPTAMYGHSMGGLICLGYEIDGRTAPDAMVVSAPAMDADAPAAVKLAAKILGRIVPSLKLPSTIKGEHLSQNPAVGEAYFADPLVHTRGTARFGKAFLEKMAHVRSRIDEIDIPVLVIHGTADPIVPPSVSAPLAAVTTIDRKLFPGFRHELHNEPDADQVLDHVSAWLEAKLRA